MQTCPLAESGVFVSHPGVPHIVGEHGWSVGDAVFSRRRARRRRRARARLCLSERGAGDEDVHDLARGESREPQPYINFGALTYARHEVPHNNLRFGGSLDVKRGPGTVAPTGSSARKGVVS